MNDQNLRSLLEIARQSDEKSFDSIFKYCYNHYKIRYTNNPDFKATFLDSMFKIWEKFILQEATLPEKPANYISRTIENNWKNYQKKDRKNKSVKMEDKTVEYLKAKEKQHEEFNPLIAQENEMAKTINKKKKIWALAISFSKLNETSQKILIARYYENKKLKDLVNVFNFKNYNTLKTKASQSKKRWQKLAKNLFYE